MTEKDGTFPQLPIIDKLYSASEAGEWIGITSRRVRQLSRKHGLGKQGKKFWQYTFEDLTILDGIHKSARRKSSMRNVTPRDPLSSAAILDSQDDLLRYVESQFKRLRAETFALIQDVSLGIHQRVAKVDSRYERMVYELEERLRTLERKEERGRAASELAGTARLTLVTYEAEAA